MRAVGLSSLARAFQKALLPALCVACDGVLDGGDRGLCGTCRSRLVPMSGPCCPRCGSASDDAFEPCLACAAAPPPQAGTVLWGAHDGILRRAILALKHGGHDELARPLGRRLAARVGLEPWYDKITVVVPVPSHRLRLLRRGASAAGLLAAEVAAELDLPCNQGLRRHGLGRQAERPSAGGASPPADASNEQPCCSSTTSAPPEPPSGGPPKPSWRPAPRRSTAPPWHRRPIRGECR